MKIKALILSVLILAAAGAFWFFDPAGTHRVKIVKPVRTNAVQAVYATGTVEASLMIPIAPKLTARLMAMNADEGSRIKAGDVLAQMEDTDIKQSLADLEAKLDLAQKEFSRAQKLERSGAISKVAFDQAKAVYTSAAASVERTKAELGYLQLIAPQDGTVIRRDGETGELVTAGTPVFWINGGDKIRIEAEVDEEDVGLVQPGQKVLISADAFPDEIFNGTVQSITPKGDPIARSYRVRVNFDAQTPMMIGMTAETNIITKEKQAALMVPAQAVKNGRILKIVDGKAEDIAVKTGIKTAQAIEITEGLSETDSVAETYDLSLSGKSRIETEETQWTQDAK